MTTASTERRTDAQRISWLRWSVARSIANSRLPQTTALIPAIGYALLWSDDFSRWMGSRELLGEGLLPVGVKLRLLWWGAIAMTLGWALYRWRCPSIIRRCAEPVDYVHEQFQTRNVARLFEIRKSVRTHIAGYDYHDKRELLLGGDTPLRVSKACDALSNANSERLSS